MSIRKKRRRRYEDEAIIIIHREITEVEYINRPLGSSYKTAFTVRGHDKDVTCVYWGHICGDLKAGDIISMKGRLNNDGIFLVWSLNISSRRQYEVL